ncbi:MFS transporter [Blastococcus sp. CT_GayMR16]|nr:MFS transporter [Blastococcus sp. CT_GayMR16]
MLWIGETTSALGTNVTRLAVPLVAVLTLDVSTFQVALLTAAGWLPWLVIGLPAGAWVDRLSRRPLMLVCDGVSLALLLSVPAAAWAGGLTFAHLLGVELLLGTAAVFFQTAYQVYLPGIVDAGSIPEANAKLQGSEAAAQVAGPGIAGLVTQAVGAVAGLLVDALSFAVSAVSLWRIRSPERAEPAAEDAGGLRRQITEGLRFLGGDPYLRVLAGYGALSNLALTGYQSILVVFLVRELSVTAATVGLLVAGMSAGGLLGAAVATTVARRLGSARGMIAANFAAGPFALLIPLGAPGPRLLLVVLGGFGIGAAVVAGNVIKGSFRQTYTPRPLLGRVVVGMQFLNYGTIPLGALLGGALGTGLGLRPTMWIMVVCVALAPLALLIGPAKRARDFPESPRTVREQALSAA